MAVALIGTVGQYEANVESWEQYTERLGHFFAANGITDVNKQRSILLSEVGPTTYALISSLVSPEKPGSKSFTDLVELLKKHFNPDPSEIVERYKFHTRVHLPNETVSQFVAELRTIARYCNFKDTLKDLLRDRIVCGINDDTIQRRLLAEKKLTLDKALEIATGMEAAKQNLSELHGSSTTPKQEDVHKMAVKPALNCYRCNGSSHTPDKCKFKTVKCHNCGKMGHVQRACRSAPNETSRRNNKGKSKQKPLVVRQLSTHPIHHVSGEKPFKVNVTVEDHLIEMEVDTGASISIVSYSTFRKLWPEKSLKSAQCVLKAYSGTEIQIRGEVEVRVQHNGQEVTLPWLVVDTEGPTLLGRNWLEKLQLNWKSVFQVNHSQSLEQTLTRHKGVFEERLGKLRGYKAKIYVDPEAKPKFVKARSVPYSMKVKIEEELARLTSQGILEPVRFADWATPIVPVIKPDRSIRLCADFKVTINQHAKLDHYPIPKIEDLFATLGSGNTYTKLDMSQAYQQVELDDESMKYTVVNTHKGLYRYTRLPFGIASAPATFQRVMEGVLRDIPGVIVYLDDVLITGKSNEEHLKTLETVLSRFEEAGLQLKRNKCSFMVDSVTYLGHRIDTHGLHPLQEKVEAIHQAPPPKNVSELKAFLGLLTYYNRFLCDLSTVLFPLYRLLRKDVRFRWTQCEEDAFRKAKNLLTSSNLLVHYDSTEELVMAFDASPYGVGAVLAHVDSQGRERPIGFVSRTLSKAEQNYAQMEREGLACIFGLKKFHSYLYGRSFKIYTDNLALKNLFSEKQAVPQNVSARVLRWAMMLSSYDYQIVFRPSFKHSNADALSRLPLVSTLEEESDDLPTQLVLLLENMEDLPVTANAIKQWTKDDSVLARVYKYTQCGWPDTVQEELKPYHRRSTELSTLDGCLLIGARV